MKKLLAGTLTAAFALGLTACGQQEECSAKPVIYLYPEQETTVSVSLDYAGTLTATYPAYEDGWRVTAEPDGTLYDENGDEYSYLFWEGENNTDYDFSTGFCVAGADTADFLREKLAEIGLTPREYNEFIVYWLPKMQDNPQPYFVPVRGVHRCRQAGYRPDTGQRSPRIHGVETAGQAADH